MKEEVAFSFTYFSRSFFYHKNLFLIKKTLFFRKNDLSPISISFVSYIFKTSNLLDMGN